MITAQNKFARLSIMIYQLYRDPVKKFRVYVLDHGKVRGVSFGARGYSDYTIHHDKMRRDRYRRRHRHDAINDPLKPGFWAWHVLWGDSPDLQTAFRKACRLAIKILN
jgi:hypothetical protein